MYLGSVYITIGFGSGPLPSSPSVCPTTTGTSRPSDIRVAVAELPGNLPRGFADGLDEMNQGETNASNHRTPGEVPAGQSSPASAFTDEGGPSVIEEACPSPQLKAEENVC
jgi:hypothetical protein